MQNKIELGLTFDDVLLKPDYSEILPANTSTVTNLTKNIKINIPIISAAMDTVTEHQLAIVMAQNGGIGCIHKNLSLEQQVEEVKKVKKYESCMVRNPITVKLHTQIKKVKSIMQENAISGIPVVAEDNTLLGIVTNRDVRFFADEQASVEEAMTKNNLITVDEDSELSTTKKLLHQHKIERIIVVDDEYKCVGLVTVKDIEKARKYPQSIKDSYGQLCVAASVGTDDNSMKRTKALVQAGVDVIVVDTAHGHSKLVIQTVEKIKQEFPDVDVIAGNISTSEGALALIKAGVDAVKVGIGPGSICTTRVVAGVGVPQLTAIMDVAKIAKKHHVPVIADGGMKLSGDVVKALAAGASSVMLGGMFAGTEETPGKIIFHQGKSYKNYRGMGSIGAMARGSADRYFQQDMEHTFKLIPEGIEGRVPYKGKASDVIHQIVGGIKAALGYTGQKNIQMLQEKGEFIRITNASLKESHPHNIVITDSAPNYGVTS